MDPKKLPEIPEIPEIPETLYHCGKCGKSAKATETEGWLIAQRINRPEGWLIIRCPEHVTDYARRLAGMRQEYYHQHKKK